MANKKITDVNKIMKIKESVIKAFDNKIDRLNMENTLKTLNESSVGLLTNIFENISDKLFEDVKGKRLIKKYVNLFKTSNNMKNAYIVNETLNKIVVSNNVENKETLLETVIKLSNSSNKSLIAKDKKKLVSIIKECIVNSNITNAELVSIIESYNNDVTKSINFIVENKLNTNNIIEYNNAISVIKENIVSNTNTPVLESKNYKYSDLSKIISECETEWEKQLMTDISVYSIANNGDFSELFEKYKNECLNIINESKDGKNIEEISELEAMYDKLSKKTYNKENINEDLLKLSELKYTIGKDE